MAASSSHVRTVIPALNILPKDTPSNLYASNVAHFSSIPWTAALLRQPATVPFIPMCRNPGDAQHDQFFGNTLSNERGIPHMLSFFTRTDQNIRDPDTPVTKASTLFQLGHGVTGGPSILHGGMTMAMVDEAMCSIPELNHVLGKNGASFTGLSVTGMLDIKFLKPVFVGRAVIATAWLEGAEGRKTRVRCEVRDEDGLELARCSSTWVTARPTGVFLAEKAKI